MGKKIEVQEVEVKLSASKLWKVLGEESSVLIPKLLPNEITSIEILEGGSGVGSVRLVKLAPGVAPFTEQKEKITELDEEKRVVAFEVVEGGAKGLLFESLHVKVEIKEKGDGVCVVKHTVEYVAIGEQKPTPVIDGLVRTLKAIEAHIHSA